MPVGIVEELFIATDPDSGLVEVFYRNSNVTQSLQIRADFLPADPESVQWGTWTSQFVVRTGTSSATQQYHIFTLIRVGLTSGEDGIGPTAVAHFVKTEKPFESTLSLLLLNARVTVRRDNNYHINSSATYTLPGGIPTYQSGSSSAVQGAREAIGTGSRAVSLLNLLALGASVPSYGLDAYGDLILAVRGTIPDVSISDVPRTSTSPGPASGSLTECASITTTTNDTVNLSSAFKNDSHLWVINHTRSLILFRTTKATPNYESESFDAPSTPGSGIGAWTVVGSGSGCDSHGIGATVEGTPGSSFSTVIRVRSGTTTLKDDTPWVALSFIDTPLEHDFRDTTPTELTAGTSFATIFGGAFPWFANGTRLLETFADEANFWRYTVSNVWLLDLRRPMRVVVWIRRSKSGSTSQDGLFIWNESTGRFTTIYKFTDIKDSFDVLATLTGNARDLIWELNHDSGADFAQLFDLDTTRSVGLGTNLTTLRDHYLKMIGFRFLYRAAEDQPTTSGYFVSAWNVGGDPVEINMGNPAAVSALTPYASLAALPSGVAAPVIARAFRKDVILKDDWDNITSGVVSVPDDGVGVDVGAPGDPVMRAIILCRPSTEPGAFIARFPGRSDGAEGTPAPLEVTASGRITENKFTSALSAQRYEDEMVLAFVVSNNTSALMMLPQELQSTGVDTFRTVFQVPLQPNKGGDTHRAESVELLLRRGPGQSHPGTAIMAIAPVTSNILDNQGGTIGTEKDVPGLGDATAPVKAPIGQLVTGRFLSFKLTGTNVNSVLRYLGSFIRGRRQT